MNDGFDNQVSQHGKEAALQSFGLVMSIGPLVGLCFYSIALPFFEPGDYNFGETFGSAAAAVLKTIPLILVYGFVPALIISLPFAFVVAAFAYFKGFPNWITAVIIGLLPSLWGWVRLGWKYIHYPELNLDRFYGQLSLSWLWALACVTASSACWWVATRTLIKKNPRNDPHHP